MSKIDELLAVLDMTEEEQDIWLVEKFEDCLIFPPAQRKYFFADLAFCLNGGKLAGKKPIEWIVEALAKELTDAR